MPNTTETKAADNTAPAEETKVVAEAPQAETTLIETPAAETKDESTLISEETKSKEKKEPPAREGAPEKYDFKPPEGMSFDADMLSRFEGAMREADIPQKKAEAILGLGYDWQLAYQNAQAMAIKERSEAWRKESEADPDIGGNNLGTTIAAIRTYLKDEKVLGDDGARELIKVLNETGLGNHKGLLRALSIGAKLSSEDVAAMSSGRDKTPRPLKSIYDKSPGLV